MPTLTSIVRAVAARHVAPPAVDKVVAVLAERAEQAVEDLDGDDRSALVTTLSRSLLALGGTDAARIEHELSEALGATRLPQRRAIAVKDPISLIAVRNQVHQLCNLLGAPWSEGVRVQSAISDVARIVAEYGGGRIELHARYGELAVEVVSRRVLPVGTNRDSLPPWLASAVKLASAFHAGRAGEGTRISIAFPFAAALVA